MLHSTHGRMPPAHPAPMPSFMTPDQVAQYLAELRSYRPPRPGGARPLNGRKEVASESWKIEEVRNRASDSDPVAKECHAFTETPKRQSAIDACSSAPTDQTLSQPADSSQPMPSEFLQKGVGPPYAIPYYERGQRWMEKQEAQSLRRALRDIAGREDVQVYAAAQEEATQLVLKHQSRRSPYPNSDFDYQQHLRKGSHARSQSIGPFQELYVQRKMSKGLLRNSTLEPRKVSSGSNATTSTSSTQSSAGGSAGSRLDGHPRSASLRSRAVAGISLSVSKSRKLPSWISSDRTSRNTSNESNTAPFANPRDRIYEEPEEAGEQFVDSTRHSRPLQARARNTSYGQIVEQKNNQVLMSSTEPPTALETMKLWSGRATTASLSNARYQNGLEIRSDEIRAATAMKRKDRSRKLLQPSFISENSRCPVVSFDPSYPIRNAGSQLSTGRFSRQPSCYDAPTVIIPSVFDTPSTEPPPTIPSVAINGSDSCGNAAHAGVPSNHEPQTSLQSTATPESDFNKKMHDLSSFTARRPQAQCATCALAVDGKIVSAANYRFHPECFACYHCKELLECVAFYPEPENARTDRLLRYESLIAHAERNGMRKDATEDGDLSPRFYCHLDFHEIFSPRCRSCKTPIEGKVIVACGAEWHEGHFFCAECGDPFDQETQFIEKDGYAWCVQCHIRRFAGKCAGCRRPITDIVINALDREWHQECFRCQNCGSTFKDGSCFANPGIEGPTCVKCEELRLKA